MHISSIAQKLRPPKSTKPVMCKLKVVRQGVVYLWVCHGVGVAITKCLLFFSVLRTRPRSQMPHFENMQFMIGEVQSKLPYFVKFSYQRYFRLDYFKQTYLEYFLPSEYLIV